MSVKCKLENDIDLSLKPTQETYDAFQHAYDHFNWTLFEAQLPNCLITLQRKGPNTLGYYCNKRFMREDGVVCDEIAMNPVHFKQRALKDTLSTLVHEMVHLWQYHYGEPGRGRYHNREWANKMKSIGLQPSHTGEPDGKELGDQMTHYIIENGLFDGAADDLIANGFKIEWQDCDKAQDKKGPALLGFDDPNGVVYTPEPGIDGTQPSPVHPSEPKGGKRIKYTCPICTLNAWSRHNAKLICGFDNVPMEAKQKRQP